MANEAAVFTILLNASTSQANAALAGTDAQLRRTATTAESTGKRTAAAVAGAARRIAVVGAGIGAAAIGAAAAWESSFAEVRKTVDTTEAGFKDIEQGLRNLAKTTPTAHDELARLAGQAGALGVKADDIVEFTRVSAQLGVTTELSADDAATALARLANILDVKGRKAFERMGSVLVDLGNKGSSTEGEITEMALRIARGAGIVGLSAKQVLGLSASLADVGIRAEAGGSSVSRAFLQMNEAVKGGGKELEVFAKTAGMTTDEFKRMFETDTPQALQEFADGLARADKEGKPLLSTLDKVHLNEQRVKEALLALGQAQDDVSVAQKIANEAWGENSALAEEANERYKTTASQFQILKNRVQDVGISFGQDLLPKVNEVLMALGEGKWGEAVARFAELGGEIAAKFIGAMISGFAQSDLVGKLAIGTGLMWLLGGKAGIVKSAAYVGRLFGIGMATNAATTMGAASAFSGASMAGDQFGIKMAAAKAAGATTGATVGTSYVSKLGGVLRSVQWAKIGWIGLGIVAADKFISEFDRQMRISGDDMWASLEAQAESNPVESMLRDFGNLGDKLAGGVGSALRTVTGIDPQWAEDLADEMGKGKDEIKDLIDQMKAMENAGGNVTQSMIDDFRDMSDGVKFDSKVAQDAFNQFTSKVDRQAMRLHENTTRFLTLRDVRYGWDKDLNKMAGLTDNKLSRIQWLMNDRPKKGAKALDQAFDNAVKSIEKAMEKGEIKTLKGMQFIHQVMNSQLQARYGISHADAERILKAQKPSKKGSGWSGLARGGYINQGAPQGDSVPTVLERGEYVLNRNAVKAAGGKRALDAFNYAVAPRMAKGGAAGFPELSPAARSLASKLATRGFQPTSTRRATTTYHGSGDAIDYGDSVNNLRRLWGILQPRHAGLAELFGPSYLNPPTLYKFGVPFSNSGLQASHEDHIHVAILGALAGLGGRIKGPRFKAGFDMTRGAALGLNRISRAVADEMTQRAMAATSDTNASYSGKGNFTSTAYGPPWGGIQGTGVTATGVDLTSGPKMFGVAVDPSVIPLGSSLNIRPNPFNTSHAFKAFDTGGAIKGKRIDFYDWLGRAHQMQWGTRPVNVAGYAAGGMIGMAKGGDPSQKGAPPNIDNPFKYARTVKAIERARQWMDRLQKSMGYSERKREALSLAEERAGLPWSPEGEELSEGEKQRQINIHKMLIGSLEREFKSVRRGTRFAERGLASASPKQKKRLRQMLDTFGTAKTRLVGLTGRGGELNEARTALRLLQVVPEPEPPEAMNLAELMDVIQAARYGVFDRRIPRFHSGGIFRAPAGRTEGPAILRDGERVSPASQPVKVELHFAEGMGWLSDFVTVKVDEREQRAEMKVRAGRRR